jgi:protein tyrosine/serine phosphatase
VTDTIAYEYPITRRLPVGGTANLRDVGGYATSSGQTVRWKTLLRSDSLHRVDELGLSFLGALGFRTLLDLRETDERAMAPSALSASVRRVDIPLFTHAGHGELRAGPPVERADLHDLEAVYRMLINDRGAAIVEVIRELSRPGTLPAIVHCALGKDRTGIVIALVLSLLGVPEDVIVADYAATRLFIGGEFKDATIAQKVLAGFDPDRVDRMLSCDPELIIGALAEVRDSYGTVVAYLKHHGLTSHDFEALRGALLEPSETD